MYCKRFRLLVAAAVCTTLALVTLQRPASAEEPQTVERTFALLLYCEPYYMDPPPELSDFVNADTVAILLGDLDLPPASLIFEGGSPPCDGVPVSDTEWMIRTLRGNIVNKKSRPMEAWVLTPGGPQAPAHAVVVASRITAVHACWLKFSGGPSCAIAQDAWNGHTRAIFIIVTAEFRVKD